VESLNHVFWRLLDILNTKVSGSNNADLIAQDFHGYWMAHNNLFLGTGKFSHGVKLHSMQFDKDKQITSCNSAWLLQDRQKFHGLESAHETGIKFLMLDLPNLPNEYLAGNWPPKTVSNIFSYLSTCERDLAEHICKEIHRLDRAVRKDSARLLNNSIKKNGGSIGLILRWGQSDESIFGVTFSITGEIARAIASKRIENGAALLRKCQGAIKRHAVFPASPNFIHTHRALSTEVGLGRKSILLIGAGAIGSHLAPMLCALGAGQGNGALTVCDRDLHKLGNVSRSALGLNFVGKSKASAIQEQLKISYPYAKTKIVEDSYSEISTLQLNGYDLIIDATGSPEVGIGLSIVLAKGKTPRTVIHTWIHGQGLAAVNFVSQGRKPCYRCLWHYQSGNLEFRYKISKHPEDDEIRIASCHESFMPYSITASVAAATLAITSVEKWVMGQAAESLTYKLIRSDRCRSVSNISPNTGNSCPICNQS
jgi:hypothetical protein